MALSLAPALSVDASFSASRLDLDRWLAALAVPDQLATPPAPEPAAPAAAAAPAAPAPPAAAAGWLAGLSAKLAFEVGEVIYNTRPVRGVALQLEARGGAVAVPKFTATLPGDLVVQASSTLSGDPARPTASGAFSLVGPRLRETLAWLAVDVSAIPAGKLTRLAMNGRMGSMGGNVQVTDATVELDDLKGSGGIVVAFAVPLSVTTHVELGTLDIDSYLPAGPQAAASSPVASVTPILALLGPSIGLKLRIARIEHRGQAISGVELDVARDAGTLRLNEVRVADLAGARIAVRGAVASYWTAKPRADFAFDLDAPDMDRVLALAGGAPAGPGPQSIPQSTPQSIGALRLHGAVAGSWESLALRDVALDAMGWSVRASGTLALPGAAEGTIRSAAYKGRIVVNGQPIDAAIDYDLTGHKPVIAADLAPTGSTSAGWAGWAPRPAAPPRDLAPSRRSRSARRCARVDGTLRVAVASLGGGAGAARQRRDRRHAEGRHSHRLAFRAAGSMAGRSAWRAWSTAASRRCRSTSRAS